MHKISSLDRFLFSYEKLVKKNSKIGIYANQISFSFYFKKYIFECIPVEKIFLLEHGFFSELQDQVSLVDLQNYNQISPIQWISLYGYHFESLYPSLESLQNLDVIVIDIQDVGSRYYTFLTSVYYLIQTIFKHQLPIDIVVIDRYNPCLRSYKRRKVEGTPLEKKYESFVGVEGILHQHGLTSGEMIYYFSDFLKAIYPHHHTQKLYIIPFQKKSILAISDVIQNFALNENLEILPFMHQNFLIYPSPNMPSITTARVYTGQCLWEGTNLSEGRGTTKPFEIVGAPYLNSSFVKKISEDKNIEKLGAFLRYLKFVPSFHKFANQICYGWQIYPQKNYHSLLTSLYLLKEIKKNFKEFDWYRGIYEFKNEYLAIEYLLGDTKLIHFLENSDDDFDSIAQYVFKMQKMWLKKMTKYYLY